MARSDPYGYKAAKRTRGRIARRLRRWATIVAKGQTRSGVWDYQKRKDGKGALLYKGTLSNPPRVVAVFEKMEDVEDLVAFFALAANVTDELLALAEAFVRDRATARFLAEWELRTASPSAAGGSTADEPRREHPALARTAGTDHRAAAGRGAGRGGLG